MHDVLIVGAGVAGSTTALHLARKGHQVLLIDRAQFPRSKACGEAIFPSGVEELARLGLLPEVREVGTPLTSLTLEMEGLEATARLGTVELPALGVHRTAFDHLLLRHAEKAGVDVRLGVTARRLAEMTPGRYELETTDGAIRARLVVGSDGLRSAIRTQAGLNGRGRGGRYGASAHVSLPQASDRVQVHLRRGFEVYVTPVGAGEANVAVLMDNTVVEQAKGDFTSLFQRLLAEAAPGIESILFDEPQLAGPFPGRSTKPFKGNVLLVGDAAGFSDPITGQGMSLALRSARLAAKALEDALVGDTEAAFTEYAANLQSLRRPSNLCATALLSCSKQASIGRWFLRNLHKQPTVFQRLARFNDGTLPLSAMRPRDLLGLTFGL